MQAHQGNGGEDWWATHPGRKIGWHPLQRKLDLKRRQRDRERRKLKKKLGFMGATHKKQLFVDAYIRLRNPSQAAIEAGYSPKSARSKGPQLMKDELIKKEIDARLKTIAEKVNIDAAYVLKQAVKIHERCMQEVKPYIKRGKHQKTDEGDPIYIFDAAGATRSLELVGKHIDVGAWKSEAEHGAKAGDTLSLTLQNFIFNALKTNETASAQPPTIQLLPESAPETAP
jgi:phage terminase small subunit